MLNTPFPPWPSYTEQETEEVARVLRSNRVNYWTGNECRDFEREFADWCGARHAVALANGTVALELALRALKIGAGDEVVVAPRTFLASASAIVAVGAEPVFADVDRDSQNITAETAARVLTPRTKAIMCVHLAGWPCEMDGLSALAQSRGLLLIEDCAQAHGAKYRGVSVGRLGHAAAWSFCQDKIITTGGEGGMLTTSLSEVWNSAWAYKDHGKSYDAVYRQESTPGFRWVHESFGTNWRMLEMQGALGRIQLRRMADWHARRTSNALAILAACSEIAGLRVAMPPAHVEHAWYRAYTFIEPRALASGWSRDRVIETISKLGVPCYHGSCSEVYLERAFEGTRHQPRERLVVAQQLGDTSMAFLVHPTLRSADIEKTIEVVRRVMHEARR